MELTPQPQSPLEHLSRYSDLTAPVVEFHAIKGTFTIEEDGLCRLDCFSQDGDLISTDRIRMGMLAGMEERALSRASLAHEGLHVLTKGLDLLLLRQSEETLSTCTTNRHEFLNVAVQWHLLGKKEVPIFTRGTRLGTVDTEKAFQRWSDFGRWSAGLVVGTFFELNPTLTEVFQAEILKFLESWEHTPTTVGTSYTLHFDFSQAVPSQELTVQYFEMVAGYIRKIREAGEDLDASMNALHLLAAIVGGDSIPGVSFVEVFSEELRELPFFQDTKLNGEDLMSLFEYTANSNAMVRMVLDILGKTFYSD